MNAPAQPSDRRVAVIGAGILGLATARALRERGEEAVIYESGIPGNGQSAAESRIFRHSHDDARLVELAKESRAIWSEWERELDLEMISGDGVVALGEPALERLAVIERAGGADVAEIGSEQVSERLPPLAAYNGAATVDASGGAIRTRNAIEALTRELDGSFRFGDVISLRQVRPGAVEVRAGGEAAEYERVVVCAGRGTAALARGVGLCLPLTLSAHVRVAFAVRGEAPRRLACLQDSSGEFGETGIYAAPMPDRSGYAVGLSETVAAEDGAGLVDPRELASHAERVVAYVERALPGLDPKPVGHLHCWVTALPWNDDAVAISEHGDLVFAYGHNLFKLAPAMGRILARAALGEGVDERLRSEARLGEPVDRRR